MVGSYDGGLTRRNRLTIRDVYEIIVTKPQNKGNYFRGHGDFSFIASHFSGQNALRNLIYRPGRIPPRNPNSNLFKLSSRSRRLSSPD